MKKATRFLAYNLLVISLFIVLLSGIQPVQAGSLWDAQDSSVKTSLGQAFGQSSAPQDVRGLIVQIIKVFLSFLGLIFIIYIIIAGVKWMTSAGNEERVREARRQLLHAAIGFTIIIASYALTEFIYRYVIYSLNLK